MKNYFADKTCLNIIKTIITVLIAIVILLAYYFLSFIPIIMWIIITVFFAAGFFIIAIYLPLYFKNAQYYVLSKKIIKHCGVFYRTSQTMHFDAIQYTTVMSLPFSKKTGFNFIILNAFGGRMILGFLRHRDLEELMSEISVYK